MLDRLERAIERIVEGSMAGVFRLRVQPAEIGRRLERAMLNGRVTSMGAMLAPNHYEVRLHPDDAGTFNGWEDALCREMETWLAELAFERGLATIGPIRVTIVEDEDVSRRSVRAGARFSSTPSAGHAATGSRTYARSLHLLPADPSWPDVTLDEGAITVGRATDNDLVIPAAVVSRHHARIESHGAGWRVIDLDSTNGTWVNGASVGDSVIDAGDELSFGGARFIVVSR